MLHDEIDIIAFVTELSTEFLIDCMIAIYL